MMKHISNLSGKSISSRANTDTFFSLADGSLRLQGVVDKNTALIETMQLLDENLWKLFVNQFRGNVDDDDNGWRCEYWGKMMRGACLVYQYTQNFRLYEVMEATVKELLGTQRPNGRICTYSVEREFNGWDLWGSKYVMLGMEYFYDICTDEALKAQIVAAMKRHADYIVAHIGSEEEGKKQINTTGAYFKGLNSSSILEPFVRLYNLTGEQRYLDFAKYIIGEGCVLDGNIFELAYEGKLYPYQYPQTKAYEMMSCFEGLLEYYRITGEEKHLISVKNFVRLVRESEVTIIGALACKHEFFNHSAKEQGNFAYEGLLLETCVTVTWMKLCTNLMMLTGDASLVDYIELSAYNALYGALNTENVTCNGALPFDSYSPLFPQKRGRGIGGLKYMQNGRYYGCCACIGAAGIGIVPQVSVLHARDGIVFNLYSDGKISTKTPVGDGISFTVSGHYPYHGNVILHFTAQSAENFKLYLRIPSWSKHTTVTVDEEPVENVISGAYLTVDRVWNGEHTITLCFDMTAQYIYAPVFDEMKPYAAIRRGPVILARDTRLQEKADELLQLDLSKEIVLTPSEEAKFATNLEFLMQDERGHRFHLIDYASAGKTLNEDSMMTAWLPLIPSSEETAE